jgi:hypothetical protein
LPERFLSQLLSSFLAARPPGILYHSEWIGNNMTIEIHLMWQHAKIKQIRHFSSHSKIPPEFRTLPVFDRQPVHEGLIFLRTFGILDVF